MESSFWAIIFLILPVVLGSANLASSFEILRDLEVSLVMDVVLELWSFGSVSGNGCGP